MPRLYLRPTPAMKNDVRGVMFSSHVRSDLGHKLIVGMERELRIPLASESDMQYPPALSAYVEEGVVRRVVSGLRATSCCAWALVAALVSMGAANFLLLYNGYTNVLPYSFPGMFIVFLTMVCCISAAHRKKVRRVLARARAESTLVRWDLDATHLVITYPVAAPAADYGALGHTAPVEPA